MLGIVMQAVPPDTPSGLVCVLIMSSWKSAFCVPLSSAVEILAELLFCHHLVLNRLCLCCLPVGTIFLRVMRPEDRVKWLNCLHESLEVYGQHQTVVNDLKNKGMIPPVSGSAVASGPDLQSPFLEAWLAWSNQGNMPEGCLSSESLQASRV